MVYATEPANEAEFWAAGFQMEILFMAGTETLYHEMSLRSHIVRLNLFIEYGMCV